MTEPVRINIDLFMDETGHFGRFEALTYALLSVSIIYCSFTTFSYSFTAGIINHRCFVPECENKSDAEYKPNWIDNSMDFETGVECDRYNLTAAAERLKPRGNSSCPVIWFNKNHSVDCDKKDLIYQYDDITIMHEFNMQCDNTKWVGLVGTLHNTGQAFGFPSLGFLSDRFGRKPILIITTLFTVLFGVLHMFSKHFYDFVIYEIFMGYFVTGIYNSAYVLGVELVGKKARVAGGVTISTFYCLGLTFLGGVAVLIRDWKIYSYIHIPFIVCVCYFWLVTESTRWLNTKGKEEELKKKLIFIAKLKGYKYTEADLEKFRVTEEETVKPSTVAESKTKVNEDENVKENENENENKNATENEEPAAESEDKPETETGGVEMKQKQEKRHRFRKLFHSKILFLRIINCYYCWVTNALIYVGLQLAAVSAFGNRHVNFIITGLIEIPAYIITPFLADHIGRRNTLSGSLVICGICSLSYPFLSDNIGGTIIYFTAKLAITVAYAVIYVFTAELFPTEIRHTLMGTCSMVARIGAITAPQWQVLNNIKKGLPFYIFAFTALSSGGLIFLLPETLKLKLPDTIEEAEKLGRKSVSK